ncbi:MAG: DUF262 domain-containing protein [Okeania sp. SIO3C4]|nr:DUF262 domain-containing protein [Okeania sp. SIO3B3]NER05504.1 DUF262 domain-containing protein [Okeania sp. SIO3C4]
MSEQEIKSQDLNIDKLFEDFYIIPEYQREYVWKEDNVEQLLKDIFAEFPSSNYEHKADDYFIGSIIVCNQDDGEDNLYVVIDGQQRITTIYIISCVIRNYINRLEDHKTTDNIKAKILGTYTDSKGYGFEKYKVKVQYDDRNEILETFAKDNFDDIDYKAGSDSINFLIDAYHTVWNFIKTQFNENEDEIRKFYVHLTRKVKLVRVTTSDINHALRVFETINDRGVGLNAMDLLKNLIFKNASSDDYENLNQNWKQIIDILESVKEKPFNFLRHFIFAQYNAKRDDVQSKEYEWILQNDNICKYSGNPMSFIKNVKDNAEAYSLFLQGNNIDQTLNRYLDNIKNLTSTSREHMSVLLAAKNLEEQLFLKLCRELENFLFLIIITKQKTNEYECTFISWSVKLRSVKTQEELDKFLEEEIYVIKQKLKDKFIEAFENFEESDTQKYKLKYILAKLTQYIEEKDLGEEKPQSDLNLFLKPSIEIEHILPQKPSEEVIKNFDKPNEIKKYSSKLGNLTLLEKSINASIQNSSYSSKIEPYKQSKLYLTKSIVESIQVGKNSQIDRAVKNLKPFEQWTSNSIEERQKILANLALEVWNMSISE